MMRRADYQGSYREWLFDEERDLECSISQRQSGLRFRDTGASISDAVRSKLSQNLASAGRICVNHCSHCRPNVLEKCFDVVCIALLLAPTLTVGHLSPLAILLEYQHSGLGILYSLLPRKLRYYIQKTFASACRGRLIGIGYNVPSE